MESIGIKYSTDCNKWRFRDGVRNINSFGKNIPSMCAEGSQHKAIWKTNFVPFFSVAKEMS